MNSDLPFELDDLQTKASYEGGQALPFRVQPEFLTGDVFCEQLLLRRERLQHGRVHVDSIGCDLAGLYSKERLAFTNSLTFLDKNLLDGPSLRCKYFCGARGRSEVADCRFLSCILCQEEKCHDGDRKRQQEPCYDFGRNRLQ